ncbi:uncharacterized protein [Palaemon carinicauda]|uniref:uncharacterized protein n=1 Tax=Palaemon carinicauda TaxID=392227 RepID=UPI0035B5D5D2
MSVVTYPVNDSVVTYPINDSVVTYPVNDSVVTYPINDSVVTYPVNECSPPKPPKRKMQSSTRSPLAALIYEAIATSPTGYLSLNEVFLHLKDSSHPYVRNLSADRLRKRIGDHLLTSRLFSAAPESFRSGRFRRYGLSPSEPAPALPSSPIPGPSTSSAGTVQPLGSGWMGSSTSSAGTVQPLGSGWMGPSTSSAGTVQPLGSGWMGNYGILIPPFVYVTPQVDVSVSNPPQGQSPSCQGGTSYSPVTQVISAEPVSQGTSTSNPTSFTYISSCSVNPASSCSINPTYSFPSNSTSSCSVNPTSSCSINPTYSISSNPTSSCLVNPTISFPPNPESSCSLNPTASCSLNPTAYFPPNPDSSCSVNPTASFPPNPTLSNPPYSSTSPSFLHPCSSQAITSQPAVSLPQGVPPTGPPPHEDSSANASQLPPSRPEAISLTSSSSTSVSPASEMSPPSLPLPALSPPPSFDLLCQMSSFVPESTHTAARQPSTPPPSSSEVTISPVAPNPVTSQPPRLCTYDLPNPEDCCNFSFFASDYHSSSDNLASTSSSTSPSAYLSSSSSVPSTRPSSACEGSYSQTSFGNGSGTEQTEQTEGDVNSDTQRLEDLDPSLPNPLLDFIEELYREWQVNHGS